MTVAMIEATAATAAAAITSATTIITPYHFAINTQAVE